MAPKQTGTVTVIDAISIGELPWGVAIR